MYFNYVFWLIYDAGLFLIFNKTALVPVGLSAWEVTSHYPNQMLIIIEYCYTGQTALMETMFDILQTKSQQRLTNKFNDKHVVKIDSARYARVCNEIIARHHVGQFLMTPENVIKMHSS